MSFARSRAALLLAVMCAAACGSPPPSAVDEELLLVDLTACARGEAVCERSGQVGPGDVLVEGNHAVVLWARVNCGDEQCDIKTQECCAESPNKCVAKGECGGAATVPPTPARISLPLRRASDDARLTWIALGMAAGEPSRRMTVTIVDGEARDETVVEPIEGFARVEVSGRDRQPAAGARLELTVSRGIFAVAWVVGRWKR